MIYRFSTIILALAFSIALISTTPAQGLRECSYVDRMVKQEKLTSDVRERLIKLCIEEQKKAYEKMINNSEEIAKISKELEESFEKNNKFSSSDQKKLKQVEKLLKNVRKELRAKDYKEDDKNFEKDKPSDTLQAIKDLQEKTKNLLDEVKKSTRHTISTAAIQSSNAVLKIVKFLRFGK